MRGPNTRTTTFSFEYPLPNHSADTEWAEVEYEVEFFVDPGEPVTWDCPGAAPSWDGLRSLRVIENGRAVGPDLAESLGSNSWPGWDTMEAAIEEDMEEVYAEAPASHRYNYY